MVSGVYFKAQHSKHQRPPVEVVAHRGARTLADWAKIAPGNTLPAFKEAVKHKASIELDVIATRDGRLIIHHDDRLGRVFKSTNNQNPNNPFLKNLTFQEIQNTRLNEAGHNKAINKLLESNGTYRLNPDFKNAQIPSIKDVLKAFPKTHFYIELKTHQNWGINNNQLEKLVVELIKKENLYDQVTVISFNFLSLLRVRLHDRKIALGFDTEIKPFYNYFPFFTSRKNLLLAKLSGIQTILPEYKEITKPFVDLAHRLGIKVYPYVSNETRSEEQALFPQLSAMGVDGIVTNAVDLLQEFNDSNNPHSKEI